MAKRSIPEINAGSMADIAFLLLIFFLVTTTMSTDMGIVRKLPPLIKDNPPVTLNKRNLLNVRVNRSNQIMVNGQLIQLSELKEKTKEFIQNPDNKSDLPELKLKEIHGIGEIKYTSQHVISLMNDRGTTYKTYIAIQNELAAAYNELRNKLALELWNKEYEDLSKIKKKAIDEVYGMKISEADPVNIASN
jgi:biopolymer transport protein ExbD